MVSRSGPATERFPNVQWDVMTTCNMYKNVANMAPASFGHPERSKKHIQSHIWKHHDLKYTVNIHQPVLTFYIPVFVNPPNTDVLFSVSAPKADTEGPRGRL